jgi:hypothetical protein
MEQAVAAPQCGTTFPPVQCRKSDRRQNDSGTDDGEWLLNHHKIWKTGRSNILLSKSQNACKVAQWLRPKIQLWTPLWPDWCTYRYRCDLIYDEIAGSVWEFAGAIHHTDPHGSIFFTFRISRQVSGAFHYAFFEKPFQEDKVV